MSVSARHVEPMLYNLKHVLGYAGVKKCNYDANKRKGRLQFMTVLTGIGRKRYSAAHCVALKLFKTLCEAGVSACDADDCLAAIFPQLQVRVRSPDFCNNDWFFNVRRLRKDVASFLVDGALRALDSAS